LPSGAACRFRARHSRIPEHATRPGFAASILCYCWGSRFARLGLESATRAEGHGAMSSSSVWPKES
jgi:hypothetical protein